MVHTRILVTEIKSGKELVDIDQLRKKQSREDVREEKAGIMSLSADFGE